MKERRGETDRCIDREGDKDIDKDSCIDRERREETDKDEDRCKDREGGNIDK